MTTREAGLCLVTGATGFLGRHLVRQLVEGGRRVRATDRGEGAGEALAGLELEYLPADLAAPETLPRLFEGEIDTVYQVGGICNLSTPYERLAPVNVDGVGHVARLAAEAGARRLVHVSSTSVYGTYEGAPFTEATPLRPREAYGRSKAAGEEAVWRQRGAGLAVVVARPCTIYGPGCNDGAGKAFSRASSIAAIPGSGRQLLSNVRVEDVAAALIHLAGLEGAAGEAFNIADRSHPTLAEALRLAASTFGTRVPWLRLPLVVVRALARVDGLLAARRGRIPDLELEAVRFLERDYVVDASKLEATGFELRYPDFAASLRQLGEPARGA